MLDYAAWKGSLKNLGSISRFRQPQPGSATQKEEAKPAATSPAQLLKSQSDVFSCLEKALDDQEDDEILTQRLIDVLLAMARARSCSAITDGANRIRRMLFSGAVPIETLQAIQRWLEAAGFEFSSFNHAVCKTPSRGALHDCAAWESTLKKLGSISRFRRQKLKTTSEEAASIAAPALPEGNREPRQAPPAAALPRLILESEDSRAFAPSFARMVQEKGGDFSYSPEREAWAQGATRSLQLFLASHGIPARVKRSTVTPNGCLVCFEGDERLTTRSIEKLQEVLLSTKAIKILYAKPAPGEFRILFNDGSDSHRETVSLWKAWSHRTVDRHNGLNLSFIVGLKETDGQLLYLNPDKFEPHTLIAGGTGSGKTALVQCLILDMAATNPSPLLKLYLIDPKKGVDFAPIRRLPHMAGEPVTELKDIPGLFTKLYAIMEERYALFNQAGVNKLSTYNAKVPREQRLPALFVIHDELAFCMQDDEYKKAVPPLMIQLATKCRAAGIYLILIAQRPDKDVVPVQVRDNLGNRLILKVPAGTSEFALGEKGAENLLGKGHLAAKLGGQDGFVYAQVPFLSDRNEVLQEVVDAITAADQEWN